MSGNNKETDKVPPIKVSDLKKRDSGSKSSGSKLGSKSNSASGAKSYSKSGTDRMKDHPSSKSTSPPKVTGVTPVPPKSQMDLMLATMQQQSKLFEGLATSLGNLLARNLSSKWPERSWFSLTMVSSAPDTDYYFHFTV